MSTWCFAHSSDPYEHLMFVEWIRRVGDVEHYKGRDHEHVTVDGHRYWAMGPAGPSTRSSTAGWHPELGGLR